MKLLWICSALLVGALPAVAIPTLDALLAHSAECGDYCTWGARECKGGCGCDPISGWCKDFGKP